MKKKPLIRKIIVYALYIVLLSSVQVSFSDKLSLMGQIADLMLVFVIISGYLFGARDALVVGLATGFIRDYFSGRLIMADLRDRALFWEWACC